jgi:hypothetical protein
MRIEILYFSGCPNHHPSVDRVRKILRQETASADLVEVEIKDAAMAQVMSFLGSPSIRIDGCDIEPAARSSQAFAMGCRVYADQSGLAGVPPVEWIRAAVREAKEKSL